MSTLFAMSQVALFGREIRKPAATKGSERVESTSSAQHSSSTPMAAVGWGMPEPSATSAAQPAQSRWRINSLDMMLSAAASLGFDRGGGVSDPDEGSPPSRDELVEDEDLPTGLIGPSSSSRGSSPLYRKHDYSLEHTLDTTAPSSPCTPSMHNLTSLSAVSPTSTRSDEMAFHHQLSPQSGSHALAVSTGQATLASRPAAGQQGTVGGSNSGRFGLKLLVSNSMAGTLIGKGGTRICEIKEECTADIKVTPNGRFYPGTHERVVLVVGEPKSVQLACDRIVTTIYTAADTSLDITQRVLIPDAASSLIIGHADGNRLGDLREEAGIASIQVSPRDMCTVAGERVVTLQGAMSTVVFGLSLIVDRMMEDTTASRYQNMSTIYRAVHLHLPPYAVQQQQQQPQVMHDHSALGGSPGHPHPRPSPYQGPPQKHDFHSPSAVGRPRGGGREYGNGRGAAPWEFGHSGAARDFSHGTAGAGVGGTSSVEYMHRAVPNAHDTGSPLRPHHVNSSVGGRQFRHAEPALVQQQQQHEFEHECVSEGDFGGRCGGGVDLGVGVQDNRSNSIREYDSPSHADLRCRRPGEFLHNSPRVPQGHHGSQPGPGDFDHLRHSNSNAAAGNQQQQSRAFGRGYHPGEGQVDSSFHPLQQQRLRQQPQQQQHLRSSGDFSQASNTSVAAGHPAGGSGRGLLAHEAHASAAAAAAAAAAVAHRVHDGSHHQGRMSPTLMSNSTVHSMGSPPGELRRVAVGGGGQGDTAGLSAMFEGMSVNSPHGLNAPSSALTQLQQQQAQQAGSNSVIVHGELPVPDADVGIILGKGGATVRELQQLSGAKIMIARRNEFMPGTKHRLVTLAGGPMSVNMARFLIMRKIQTEKEKL